MENELFKFISKYITLTNEEKNAVIELNLFKSYKKGAVLLKEGDISDECYLVISGCIRCYTLIDEEEKTTDFYTESEFLAPPCIIDKTPSKYFISCIEDCIISVATSAMEKEIFEKFPRFETLCRLCGEEQLAKEQTSFADFKNSTPEQRYLNLLDTKPNLIQRVPQYQIASYLGMKPESLSRIRQRLINKEST